MTTRAFVAGATGYTGRGVVSALCARGVATLAHVRPDSAQLETFSDEARALGAEVCTSPWQPEALRDALTAARVSHVFALLGTTKKRGREARTQGRVEDYESIDLGLTLMLLKAAAASGQRPMFVYLSSAGVSPTARGAYYRARAEAERAVRDSGLPWLIVRPSFITGPDRQDRRPLERVAASVADAALGLGRVLGLRKFADRYQSMSGPALGQAIVEEALEGAPGRVVHREDLVS